MVLFAPLVGAAVFLSGFATAIPTGYGSSSSGSSYGSSGYDSSDSSSSNYGSSDGSSSYGSSGSSGYGSSDSSYGGDSSGYSGDSSYGDNSYSSSMMMMEDSSTMMMDTQTIDSTSTTTGYNSYQTGGSYGSSSYGSGSYGSGSSNWGGSGYEDCVNQCIAQYGSGMGGEYQATQTASIGGYGGDSGSGATHTIVVAPSKGVFRMIPFMTNASVGDTLEFHWGADMHTVTKSSALLPCNKSTEDPVFATGEQNEGFVFRELVNNTDPTFYYCGTPGHCEKGMFGVINPQMALPGGPTSFGGMMSSMAANDSDLSTYAAYTKNTTSNNEAAGSWGMNFDMSAVPDWAQSLAAENIMYTQNMIAMNSWVMSSNGMDLNGVANKSLMLPMDTSVLNAASSGSAAASASAAPAAPTPVGDDAASAAASASASASSNSSSNGANSVASPRFLVAAVVVLATIFAL